MQKLALTLELTRTLKKKLLNVLKIYDIHTDAVGPHFSLSFQFNVSTQLTSC